MNTSKRIRGESGQALVMVLALVVIVLGFGVAVLSGALSAGQLTTHDARVRRAQQGAEAGVQSQLYQGTENNLASAYNFTGGLLGLTGFLDCLPLQVNANLQVTGFASARVNNAGVCPPAINGTTGNPVTPYYTPLANHTYVESEFLSNTEAPSSAGLTQVEFPEIVSIGCDSATASTCGTSSSNAYARELALLQPTGPIQAIEGMGAVTVTGLKVLLLGNVANVVNGDIMAGGSLSLPAVAIATNTNWRVSGSIIPTFGYGTSVSTVISTANLVHLTGGFCTAGSPSAACQIKRPAPTVTATTCAACATGITCSSCTGGGYNSSTDTFTLTGGTATFASGDYVFCNFSATGTATVTASPTSTAPVRIFILPPNSSPCSARGYTQTSGVWNGGNFTDTGSGGLGNTLLGTVNGLANTIDPSGLQIYVAGDGSYDNANTVTIGATTQSNALTVGAVIYAPTSAVTVTTSACSINLLGLCTLLGSVATTGGVYSGAIVGDNVNITAGVITQDFDLGNYPIESGSNAYRIAEELHCDGSLMKLGGTSVSADTSGC